MANEVTAGYEKCFRASCPWLGMSVAYQVSTDAARVYESIRNGSAYAEDISLDTNIPIAELPTFLSELAKINAVYEDNNYSPNSFGTMNGRDFSIGNLYENNHVEVRKLRDRRPMPTNLMNIMSDNNLGAMVDPSYVGPAQQVPLSPTSPSQPPSQSSQPSQGEIMALMQNMQQNGGG